MAWIWLLPLFAGIADAALRNTIKLTKTPTLILLAAGFIFALPAYIVWLAIEGVPEIGSNFLPALIGHVPLMVVAFSLTVIAHRSSPMILTIPYQSLTPALLLITAPIMGGGLPTALGIFGVLIITFGIYVLNIKQGKMNLLDPFRNLKAEKGSRLMVMVAAIFAVTSNFDYIAFENSNAPFYLMVDHGLVGLSCLLLAFWDKKRNPQKYQTGLTPDGFWALSLTGLTIAASVIPHMLAFRWIPNVPYVIASKRAGAIFFAIGIGIAMGFMKRFGNKYIEERKHLGYRLMGALIITTGMLIVILKG